MYILLVRSHCAPLMNAGFKSYTALFIFKLFIVLTSLYNVYIFSLVKIPFEISLYELDV